MNWRWVRKTSHRATEQSVKSLMQQGIHWFSVIHVFHKDMHLKCFKKRRIQELSGANCKAHLQRSQLLLPKFPKHPVDLIFSGEKVFTAASPVNLQNNRVYAPSNVKCDIAPECLLRCWPTFSSSLMVTVAVSKLGCTELFFISRGRKLMTDTKARFCWRSTCCQSPVALPVTHTCFSRTVHQNSSLPICSLLTVRN